MAIGSRIVLTSAILSGWQIWAHVLVALYLLVTSVEAQSCEQTVCCELAAACLGQTCLPCVAGSNVLREEGSMAVNYQPSLAYFLDELPNGFDLASMPHGEKDATIARVRALDIPVWLGKRDQSGAQRSRDKSLVRMQVLEVRSGSASVGNIYEVYFGDWNHEMIYPLTPDQLARDYFVVMYFDPTDGRQRLVGFPVSSSQRRDWLAKRSEYWRSQYKK